MINFPTGKMRTADGPLVAFAVRRQDECALARANQYSYSAHNLLLFEMTHVQSQRFSVFIFQFSSFLSGQVRDLDHRPDLDGSLARGRDSHRDANRGVEVLGVDQEIASELF